MTKSTVPDVLLLMRRFRQIPGNEVGGRLHLVLADGNVADRDVAFCLAEAKRAGDAAAAELAHLLLAMSTTQRRKLAALFYCEDADRPTLLGLPIVEVDDLPGEEMT